MLRRRQVEQKGMVPVTATTSLLVIGAGLDALSTAARAGERGIDIVVVGRPMDQVVLGLVNGAPAAAGLIVQDLLARP